MATISRHCVQLTGGEVTVQSDGVDGRGARFTFSVPVEMALSAQAPEALFPEKAVALEPGQPVSRLLVAEDVEANRKLLVELLQSVTPSFEPWHSFKIREAVNGAEANITAIDGPAPRGA